MCPHCRGFRGQRRGISSPGIRSKIKYSLEYCMRYSAIRTLHTEANNLTYVR